jgi:hypothetical protein
MSFSRRQFIIGSSAVAAGLILPSFAARVLSHVEKTGEPLLEGAKSTDQLFHALLRTENYVLIDTSAGDTLLTPPPTTWREYFEFYRDIPSDAELEETYDLSLDDLDQEADGFAVEDQWEASRSPTAQAFLKLRPFEKHIGPSADDYHEDNEEYGYVEFCEFTNPCSSNCFVEVTSLAALSCLQHRLSDLNAGIRIEVADDDDYYG